MPAGHPEDYIEGFANLYRDAAELIAARGVAFIEASVASSRNDGAWISARLV